MSKINRVLSARVRKDGTRPNCYSCRQPIEVGTSYMWSKANRFSAKYSWHTACKPPPASALEPNEKRSVAMSSQESACDTLNALRDSSTVESIQDDVESAVHDTASGFEEAATLCDESASAIEEGFGHETPSSEQQREMSDTFTAGAEDLDSWTLGVTREEFDTDEEFINAAIDEAIEFVDSIEIP